MIVIEYEILKTSCGDYELTDLNHNNLYNLSDCVLSCIKAAFDRTRMLHSNSELLVKIYFNNRLIAYSVEK